MLRGAGPTYLPQVPPPMTGSHSTCVTSTGTHLLAVSSRCVSSLPELSPVRPSLRACDHSSPCVPLVCEEPGRSAADIWGRTVARRAADVVGQSPPLGSGTKAGRGGGGGCSGLSSAHSAIDGRGRAMGEGLRWPGDHFHIPTCRLARNLS